MTSLPGRAAVGLAIALSLLACDEGVPLPQGPFIPGISGAPLAGRLEVIVIDDETRALVPDATIGVGGIATRETSGHAVFEDARITGAVTVEVVTSGEWVGTTTWAGVAGDRVVIAVPRAAARTIEARVAGADTLGAADVVAGPLVAPRFTMFGALDRAAPIACAPSGDGSCRASFAASDGTSRAAATVRDASGAAIAFGVGDVSALGSVDISLIDPAMRAPAIALALGASLPAPPAGLDAVVGVPGLATAAGIGFLPQTPAADGALAVPELAGALADASWWVLLEARSSATPGARSVVIQRSIREADGMRAFAEFMELPTATITGGVVELGEVPGASLFAVECARAIGGLHTALVLDGASIPLGGETCTSLRVRAIDAPGATASALDLDGVERVVQRFSEIAITP